MKYMMFVCGSERGADDSSAPSTDTAGLTIEEWVEEMDGRGVRTTGDALRPTSDATTVRVRAGEVVLSDGPFADTKEQILGFDLLEAADLDEAIEIASRHPVARVGTIELRPFL